MYTMTPITHPQSSLKDTSSLGEKPQSFWHIHQHKALETKLERAIHLARTNPDYRRKYPNEARDNPKLEVRKECHKEAQIRILQEHKQICLRAEVPSVARPPRLNRVS